MKVQEYRTICTPEKMDFNINYSDVLLSLGSCFSENIGNKFLENKFNIIVNPFGQQYNPYSIATGIADILSNKKYTSEALFEANDLFNSWQHHSDYSGITKTETLTKINNAITSAHEQLKKCTVLFITFGTSHIFTHIASNTIVNNCHKIPVKNFTRSYLSAEQITEQYNQIITQIKIINPAIKIVLTVSPVRYLAFGFFENMLSKSYLFAAIANLLQTHTCCKYFPAYELVMDDLRDYRFFADDMLHPNYAATNYVWQNMCNVFFNTETLQTMEKINKVKLAVQHKPRNPLSAAHKNFIQKNLNEISLINNAGKFNFDSEISILQSQLNHK